MKTSIELRQGYLDFFAARKHALRPSAPLIPQGDASLMFTSAGMVPFKPYFLGVASGLPRATSCQKCFRTTDIERVGSTVRHLTFFEMLGNFSFGDYFKEETIAWAWEFLTKEAGFDPKRLHPTIFTDDSDAEKIWAKLGVPNTPVRLGEDTNFWTMGPTGPCGPCSEIYFDRGAEFSCEKPNCDVACGCDRYLEIWNLVFTQFDRQEDGSLKPLPRKNIDTGMGLERLLFAAQNKPSPFDTDLFFPIIENAGKILKKDFRASPEIETAFRIIADHLRASVFLLSEGVIPSNVERGYVLRRLIRRAVRYGQVMGSKEPFLYKLAPACLEIFGSVYPEIASTASLAQSALKAEEEKFMETLEVGERELKSILSRSSRTLSGEEAFNLYETFGFPLELTQEICAKENIRVDEEGFWRASKKASEIARASWKGSGENRLTLPSFNFETQFLGYDALETPAKILAFKAHTDGNAFLVLDQTAFYPEGGGQVGDQGEILGENGAVLASVIDTQKQGKCIVHILKIAANTGLQIGATVIARVNADRRAMIAPHHTGTHLLNAALRRVLGNHVRQAGSYVGPDKLRFDFTHPTALTREQILEIESLVNAEIKKSDPVIAKEDAVEKVADYGAVTLLGENYGERPRFLLIGPKGWQDPKDRFSLELCGGTHVANTAEIGKIKIIKESSAASGIRRIEAVAGKAAAEWESSREKEEKEMLQALLKRQEELIAEIHSLGGKAKALPVAEQNVARLRLQEKELHALLGRLKTEKITSVGGKGFRVLQKGELKLCAQRIDTADPKSLRAVSDALKNEIGSGIVFAACPANGKLSFVLSVTADLSSKGLNAGSIAKSFAAKFSGSAGGRADFAQGGVSGENWEEMLAEILSQLPNLS